MSQIGDIAVEFLRRGGKKLRPRLCRAVFRACGGTGDIEPICEAVECFHKASLIHDDIQDGDETRYGLPATWKEHGIAVAIAAGDWLVANGYRLIAHSTFEAVPAMLRATVESHLRLCEGQGDDLIEGETGRRIPSDDGFSVDGYISVCSRKTGEAFALAAQLGALAAGADDMKFRRYGMSYGILFQIADDIADGADSPTLLQLKEKYETETALHSDECAIGVW